MNCSKDIQDWIDRITEPREELGGNKICPYASTNYTLSIGTKIPDQIESVHICVMTDRLSQDNLQTICDRFNKAQNDLVFLPDHKDSKANINGILTGNGKHNLILIQPKIKLRNAREKLAESDYYTYWTEDYLKEILKEDYELLE